MRTIAVINQKGGCGKTTTSINLAGVFAREGLRTLLVDTDPQSHCAAGLAIPEQRIDLTIADAMRAGDESILDLSRLLWRVSRNLDLAPSTMRLAALDAGRNDFARLPDAPHRLRKWLSTVDKNYEVCLIDCSPAIGILTFNALAAADEVLVPVETGFFSLQGATKQVNTIKSLAKRLSVAPEYHILATLHDYESVLAQDLLEELKRRFASRVLPQIIRFDRRLREAASFGQPVIEYAPESMGAEDYSSLGMWLMDVLRLQAGDQVIPSPINLGELEGEADADDSTNSTGSAQPEPLITITNQAQQVLDRSIPRPIQTEPSAHTEIMPPVAPPEEIATEPQSRASEVAARAREMSEQIRRTDSPGPTQVILDQTEAAQTSPTKLPRHLFGVRMTAQGAVFVQPATLGTRVAIAGDFNGWSATANPMRLNEAIGVFESCVPIRLGEGQYRLVVDGRWIIDPYNPITSTNPFGEHNSVVIVTRVPSAEAPKAAAATT